jgi:hypothetical protein
MLIYRKLTGSWNKDKKAYEFSPLREKLLYKGRVAHALGGGGGSTSEVVATGPWQQQVPYVNMLMDQAMRLYQGGAPQYYPGQLTPGVNPTLQGSWDAANSTIGQNNQTNTAIQGSLVNTANAAGSNPVNQVAGQVAPNVAGGINSLIQGGNPALQAGQQVQGSVVNAIQGQGAPAPQTQFGNVDATGALNTALNSNGLNPYTGQIVDAALRSSNDQFNTNVLPSIRTEAGQASQVGGTRQGIAEGIAARGLAQQQGDIISRLYGQAFDAGSADRNAALGLVGQGQQANVNAALTGRGLNLEGAKIGSNLLTSGADLNQQAISTGTAQGSNLLQAGNSSAMDQYFRSLGLIPQIQANQVAQLGFQNQSGLQQYGLGQAGIDAEMDRYFYNQLSPYNALTQFQNYISGAYGSSLPGATQQNTLPQGYNFGQQPPGVQPPGTTPNPVGGFPSPGGTPPQPLPQGTVPGNPSLPSWATGGGWLSSRFRDALMRNYQPNPNIPTVPTPQTSGWSMLRAA